jgi:hypothetical protein
MELLKTEILNPGLRRQTSALANEFAKAEPYRHVVIPEFFSEEFCRLLLDDFPAFNEDFARNEMGTVGGKAKRSAVRDISTAYREVDDFIQASEFLDLISDITGIPDLLYDPEYTGGGTHENLDGQGLDPHVDFNFHPRTGWHRRLNLIVYLNPEWDESWGGNFDLHSNPWEPARDRVKTVLPLFNRSVIFETSERSWHGFAPIKLPEAHKHASRKSFAIYLYTKERPQEETAAAHATVYVPRAMPESVRPEEVLSEEDYNRVNQRFNLHRKMLQFLYQREQRFSRQIDTLRYALDEAQRSQRLELQGYAVQTKSPDGIWPDRWVSSEVMFEFSPTKPMRGLQLEVMAPPQLESPQVLEITAGEWHDSQELQPGQRHVLQLPINADAGATVKVTMRASVGWCAKDHGVSEDNRSLAYRILSAVIEH